MKKEIKLLEIGADEAVKQFRDACFLTKEHEAVEIFFLGTNIIFKEKELRHVLVTRNGNEILISFIIKGEVSPHTIAGHKPGELTFIKNELLCTAISYSRGRLCPYLFLTNSEESIEYLKILHDILKTFIGHDASHDG